MLTNRSEQRKCFVWCGELAYAGYTIKMCVKIYINYKLIFELVATARNYYLGV